MLYIREKLAQKESLTLTRFRIIDFAKKSLFRKRSSFQVDEENV
jgi:hypothetical protein